MPTGRVDLAPWLLLASLAAVLCACGPEPSGIDPDLGPVDRIVAPEDRINWPGIDRGGVREISFISGFANGDPSGYWFLGFAPRRTADSFWFCREGDEACPLDEHHRLAWDHIVGHPLFMRIPGDDGFSPFWQMWTVHVPEDFDPDAIKTIESLHAADRDGRVRVTATITDFGHIFEEYVGPTETVLHCALVLEGTTLKDIGTMPDGTGPVLMPQRQFGWHRGYRVEFIDFSPSDGVFPIADDTETRPLMPFANIYIHWRACEADPRPAICDVPGYVNTDRRPVSERGLGQDLTGDADPDDTNNVLGAVACRRQRLVERPYSPLWKVSAVQLRPEAEIALIDTYGDQAQSDIRSADEIFARVERGELEQPTPMREDETGNPVPGNEGQVFFNCPAPMPVGSVPWPCAE